MENPSRTLALTGDEVFTALATEALPILAMRLERLEHIASAHQGDRQ